jgi:hypothetical protein
MFTAINTHVTTGLRRARMLSRSGIIAVASYARAGAAAGFLAAAGGLAAAAGCASEERGLQPADTGAPAPTTTEEEPVLDTGDQDTGGEGDSGDTALDTDDSGPVEVPWAAPCDAWGPDLEIGRVNDPSLDELSGLAVSRANPNVLWTHEDHLGEPAVYAMDILGHVLGKVTLEGVENADWEDIAIGPCGEIDCIYVGETGDNDKDRTRHAVYRFPEPTVDLAEGIDERVEPDVLAYDWPEGNHDVEALAVTRGGVPVLLTKHYEGAVSQVFTFPELREGEVTTLEFIGVVSTGLTEDETGTAAATGADLWPDDSRLVVRTYGHLFEYALPPAGIRGVADAVRTTLPIGDEGHGEAIAYDPHRGGTWHVAEGVGPAVFYMGCAD